MITKRKRNKRPDNVVRATFEVPRPLYDQFMEAAKRSDRSGSQEVRQFMRDYVEQKAAA